MKTIPAKNIVMRTKNNWWFGTDYNINIYKGCSHGCIYCDSRSSCYGVDNFDTIKVKENALAIIRDDLRRKVKTGVIATGSMSDPYNPFEKKLELSRHTLELINAYNFGVAIATKSPLVCRDIDILKDIKKHSPVLAKMTITTFDDILCKKIEPRVAPSSDRFKTINRLAQNGIYCGVLLMPVLPFINDDKENILNIVRAAKDNGANFVYPFFGVTLRDVQRDYFYKHLDKDFPTIKEKYCKTYGIRYNCALRNYKNIYGVFANECEKLGITYDMKKIIKTYKMGYTDPQLSFF